MSTIKRFPIQDGPDVPWEAIEPHEGQAQRNHGQSLEGLANRGGLGLAEFWATMNDCELPWKNFAEAKVEGLYLANQINARYESLAIENNSLQQQLAESEKHWEEAIAERDRFEDAIGKAHVALGGDGEWTAKIPPEYPPDSGDLARDVPELAAQLFKKAAILQQQVDALKDGLRKFGQIAQSLDADDAECGRMADKCETVIGGCVVALDLLDFRKAAALVAAIDAGETPKEQA